PTPAETQTPDDAETPAPGEPPEQEPAGHGEDAGDPAEPQAADPPTAVAPPTVEPMEDPPAEQAAPNGSAPVEPIDGLRLVEHVNDRTVVIGSDEPDSGYKLKAEITSWGAGIKRMTLADFRMGADGDWADEPYVIIDTPPTSLAWYAATSMRINGRLINLATETQWEIVGTQETSDQNTVTLKATVVDGQGATVAEVVRTFRLIKGSYDLRLEQRVHNRSGRPLEIALLQTAQGDMIQDPAAYLGDRREYVTGYFDPEYDNKLRIYTEGSHINRGSLASDPRIWPNPELGGADRYQLAWIAAENRYFAVVSHPAVPADLTETAQVPPLTDTFGSIGVQVRERANAGRDNKAVTLTMASQRRVAPGEAADLSLGIYAGPRKKQVLADPPYAALHLDHLVRYNIGGMCSWCTFQWLAKGLLGFMKLIHAATFDWGIAIIVLVMCVRLLLHPITKRAQVNMMKMGKQMAALQPEVEKIKKKYKDDQQKLNAEMMKLYREKGVNPAGFLGCAPMLLQTPIWIALYAMLYFAIELRHEAAFYGLFQAISGGHWHFLQDLSVSDNFIRFIDPNEPGITIPFISGFLGQVRALNILPLMMAVVFFINQKFTTPPPANEQQAQQQKIMKFMVLLFPIFLYNAPSGLTLYIFTSTLFGILDGYLVRKHIKEQEEAGTLFDKKPRKPGGFMDRMSKAMEQKQIELQQKQREAQKGGGGASRSPKKRKR
ncbi:MAG: membrane protein insertase YidC, partial [Planctomycetes bacterium]|nr:membrane protein insertase YidC [Planctomycetota bacterium]